MALLEIRNLTRRFGDYTAVDDISLAVEAGEFFTLLGPSGCGKTTLLRMIAGFDTPDAGQILLDGVDQASLPPEQRAVRTVFQNYALFPHMTVGANIAFPLQMANTLKSEIQSRIDEALEDVRLTGFAARYPHELSGGQRQRVAVARALVTHPKLLLLDEPLSALDAQLREQMQIELINLQKEVGITFIYVTHDQAEALALSHRIAVMNKGQVEQLDEPTRIYNYPRSRFVADFIGTCNLFDGVVTQMDGDHMVLDVAGMGAVKASRAADAVLGGKGTIALRPEKTRVGAGIVRESIGNNIANDTANAVDENHFKGVVKELLYLGGVTVYIVETDGGVRIETMLANSTIGRPRFFEVGDAVDVAWRVDAGHFVADSIAPAAQDRG
jgi:spermidine/putrescine transport system ATP-binding protein